MDMEEEAHEAPLLTEEPFTVDGFWQIECQFSSAIWPLKDYPCSSRQFLQPNNIQAELSKLSGLIV